MSDCDHKFGRGDTCVNCGVNIGVLLCIEERENIVLKARITQLESDNVTIVEDAAMVADENKRLRRIAESAVRYLTHQDYDGLLKALRAEGYLVQQEDSK